MTLCGKFASYLTYAKSNLGPSIKEAKLKNDKQEWDVRLKTNI